MVTDVIGGHVTSKFLNILCKKKLFSSKYMRQRFLVKYVKKQLSFGPNGRKIHKIYHRGYERPFWTTVTNGKNDDHLLSVPTAGDFVKKN